MTAPALRLRRLERLHWLAVVAELRADPCTPARRVRARRADRLAVALFSARRAEAHTLTCEACGRPARPGAPGLCDSCHDLYLLDLAHWYARRGGEGAQQYAQGHFQVPRAVQA